MTALLMDFITLVFLLASGAIPEPTRVVYLEDAEACLKAGNVIANIYYGATVDEAIANGEGYCFVVPKSTEPEPELQAPSVTPAAGEQI